jgi:hypothetical protein
MGDLIGAMRQRIDVQRLYADAVEQLEDAAYNGAAPLPWPGACPFTLDQLLDDKRAALEARLAAPSP